MFLRGSGLNCGGDWFLVVPLVFKISVGFVRIPGGFDSHSPPPFFVVEWISNRSEESQFDWDGEAVELPPQRVRNERGRRRLSVEISGVVGRFADNLLRPHAVVLRRNYR